MSCLECSLICNQIHSIYLCMSSGMLSFRAHLNRKHLDVPYRSTALGSYPTLPTTTSYVCSTMHRGHTLRTKHLSTSLNNIVFLTSLKKIGVQP